MKPQLVRATLLRSVGSDHRVDLIAALDLLLTGGLIGIAAP